MQESVLESGQLAGGSSLARKPAYDLRPIVLATAYLCLYLALDWWAKILGGPASPNYGFLEAGLSFGLLLVYGLAYTPAVLVAELLQKLWLHVEPYPLPLTVAHCVSATLTLASVALVLRRMAAGRGVGLKCGRDIAVFMTGGATASAALAIVAVASLTLGGPPQWRILMDEFQRNLVGFATGIFVITPFLLVHAGPWSETLLRNISRPRPAPTEYLQTLWRDRPTTLFALTFLAMSALAFWLIRDGLVIDELNLFLIFSLPLIWVGVKQGIEGLSVAVPILMGFRIAAVWQSGTGADVTGTGQFILLIASLNSYMIGTGVTQIRATNRQMDRRDAILDAVSYAAQQFLGKSGWESGVQDVMRRLGEATSVTRVFITDKRRADRGGQAGETWLYEWTTPGVHTDENDRRVLNVLRGQLIEDQASSLEQMQTCLCRTKQINQKSREMLEALGVRSVVIVPMFVDRQWWGCVGLEQCFVERDWPASELDGLKMAVQILGTLIAGVRVEQQFRQLTGNIQAVFWISAPDGQSKQYVSPGYEEVWGRSCANLQKQPRSWLDAIHQDDQARVCEALIKQVWGEYDEEYRVVRPDGSIRWVRDRAFPVRDQTGQVYRIVGIAEDISKQKQTEEQLRAATVMLSSLIDHLQSGVVVEDDTRRITHVNQAFNDMFGVPISPKSLFGVDSRLLFLQPANFASRIEEIIKAGTTVLDEELQWKDRVFLRNYIPLSLGEGYRYHLWQYHDITVSRHAEEQIKSSLKEKEVLLKEIHHRVKNNLQIICSLLSLQAKEIVDDPKAGQTFKESQDRVKAMALIHERLYQSPDLAKIDFAGYVRSLTGNLLRSYRVNANAIRLNLEVDSVPMNLDVAIPCGLIINELVSNAFKYAFPGGESGEITVRFAEEGGQALRLTVRDTGVGVPENANPEKSESLGLKLVRSLTEQLGGSVGFRNQNGFQCDIRIPRNKP